MENCLSVQLGFHDAFVFDAANQVVEGVDDPGADVAADKHEHNVVAHLQLPFIEPNFDVVDAFHLVGGETAYDIPTMATIGEGQFWIFTMIELLGSAIIGFFFARALEYKRSIFTFAAVVAGGMALAVVVGYVVSAAFLSLNNNFIFNPAVATMLQIFPTVGDSFVEILGGICQALAVYALFPMVGGVLGFYLSDFGKKLMED